MCKNIILIGFMATGKTTIGEMLAKKIKYTFIDTDNYIIKKVNMSIADIFTTYGEDYFRALEKELMYKIIGEDQMVVSTGGGLVVDEQCFNMIKQMGIVVALEAPFNIIWGRLKDCSSRPMVLKHNSIESMRELYDKRLPIYHKADYVISTESKTPKEVVNSILSSICYDK